MPERRRGLSALGRWALRIALVVGLVAALAYAFRGRLFTLLFRSGDPPRSQLGASVAQLPGSAVTVVAEDLEVPWEIAFLPGGGLLVSERPGQLVLLDGAERRSYRVADVREAGEGGLMGLALHPDFETNGRIYLCLTVEGETGLENRVERHRFDVGNGLSDREFILTGIPGAHFHDGCRLQFGPDRHLYVTTGDAGSADRAQDLGSLGGKILRLVDDGSVPEDNPFGTVVYSYGHRNPQGLAWDDQGRLWSTEHGRSGLASGFDEINRIEAGNNYGWPVIQGDETAAGMVAPVLHSGPDYTWAPAGAAHWDGWLFFGGLRGEALYEAHLGAEDGDRLRVHFHAQFGRIRAVRVGPDSMLYFTTSNRDNRGRVRRGDDRIIRVDPGAFR